MRTPSLAITALVVATFAMTDLASAASPPAPGPPARHVAGATAVAVDSPAYLPPAKVRLRKSPGGTSIVRGNGPIEGKRGKLVRYTVEVQTKMPHAQRRAVELEAVARWVFGDQRRGWTARGARRMQRVGTVKAATIRIVLARPSEVDRRCRRGGMNTAGKYSCFTGKVAALNNLRWQRGAVTDQFPVLDQYRAYLVNHEVGHGLGYRHRSCPRKRALAHVMVQQSKSFYGCRPNGWPYP